MSKSEKIAAIKAKLAARKTSFVIQAGHPQARPVEQKRFARLAEVFPVAFSENTEAAWLIWNKIPVRLSYTYGLYTNVDSLIDLLEALTTQTNGQKEWTFISEVFITTIQVDWQYPQLTLRAQWRAKRSHLAMANVLNQKSQIQSTVPSFLAEWKIIAYQIINTLKQTQIELSDPHEQQKILRLKKIVNATNGQGQLYTKSQAP